MSRTAKQERVEQILGELAELGLMLAKDLAIEARGAETPEAKVALADAFQKISRTVRLTLALDAKLDRDAEKDARELAREAAKEAADARLQESRIMQASQAAMVEMTDPSPRTLQKRRVKAVLNRLIWNEAEGDSEDYEILLDDLDHRLWEIEDAPGFAEAPIEVLAAQLAQDMRLSGELIITTALPPLRSGGGGPLAEERVVEGASPANTPRPPLADTG